jgi:hypothetical protein
LTIGSLGYERIFTLQAESANQTRLSMRLIASNSIPLVGETVDRFDVREMATAQIDTTLRSVQKWCEENP